MTQSDERALEDARQAGIDLDLLDTIQAQSIAERWRHHDAAVNLANKLAAAPTGARRMNTKFKTKTVSFTTKGQVTIPAHFRREFQIEDGTKAALTLTPPRRHLAATYHSLVHPQPARLAQG